MMVYYETMKGAGNSKAPQIKMKNVLIGTLVVGGIIAVLYFAKKNREQD